MADKRIKKHRPSLLITAVNRLTSFIYSLFTSGRTGDMLSSSNTLCRRSFLASVFNERVEKRNNSSSKYNETVIERSRVSAVISSVRIFLMSLKLNVYGIFFAFYGLFRTVAYYILTRVNGTASVDEDILIGAGVILFCSIPLLFSSQSAPQAIASSKLMHGIIVDFLCIPEEKLKTRKQYGGTVYVFFSAVLAMVLGAFTYQIHPLYVPALLGIVILLFVVFSNPESGVILMITATPFLQYFEHSSEFLLIMTVLVALAYLCKVLQKRRTVSMSPEISIVIIFCGFIFIGGIGSGGGFETFLDSLSTIMLIFGGLFLTYNLINSEKLLSICSRTLIVSFLLICFVGIWDSVYNGISDRVADSLMGQSLVNMAQPELLYIADRGVVFGMFAILMFPMVLSYITKQNNIQGVCAVIIFVIIAIAAAWMCSHYEIIIALLIELLIYSLLYSHRSLTFVMLASVPLGIVAMMYPYAMENWYWPDISGLLMEYMPASISDNGAFTESSKSVINMLLDGNLSGIGAGSHAFNSVYPVYANAASSAVEQPMSIWLEIMCWSGIFGLASFIIFIVFMTKRSLGYFLSTRNRELRSTALALFCGIIGMLLFGSVYSVWSDMRILYLFWAFVGLLMGYIRLGREKEDRRSSYLSALSDAADAELIFKE